MKHLKASPKMPNGGLSYFDPFAPELGGAARPGTSPHPLRNCSLALLVFESLLYSLRCDGPPA
jgi:hypothetical protein